MRKFIIVIAALVFTFPAFAHGMGGGGGHGGFGGGHGGFGGGGFHGGMGHGGGWGGHGGMHGGGWGHGGHHGGGHWRGGRWIPWVAGGAIIGGATCWHWDGADWVWVCGGDDD